MATLLASRAPEERTQLLPAAAIALIAESVLLGGAIALLTHSVSAPQPQPPTTLMLAAPAPTPAAPTPKPALPVPKPVPRTATPVHHVAHTAPPKPVATPQPAAHQVASPAAVPTEPPSPPPAPAAVKAPAPAPSAPTPSFEGALRAAIQAALRYPESARMAGMSGRARVAFRYRDGAVSDVSIVRSSGIGMLDRAALAAVRDANYPKPESAFVGKTLSEQLWVTFNLDDVE
jgi:periplasmic protein TonB